MVSQSAHSGVTRFGAAALLAGDIVVAGLAPLWDTYFKQSDKALETGAAVIAVATFLGVWLLQRHAAAGHHARNSMRDGIAAAFVVTYLVIVAWAAFFSYYPIPPSEAGANTPQTVQLPPLTQALIGNFTVLTGVVVGGYFGADAVKQVTLINAQRRQSADSESGGVESVDDSS
jgi:hypothetical protein